MAGKVIDEASRKRVTAKMDALITEAFRDKNTNRIYHKETDAMEWKSDSIHGCILGEYEVAVVDWMGAFYRESGKTVHYDPCKVCGECKIREFIEDGMEHSIPTSQRIA